MTFQEVMAQVITWLQREQRVSYRALKRQLALDDDYLEDLKDELIYAKHLAADEDGRVLVWSGAAVSAPSPAVPSTPAQDRVPLTYTPSYLAEKILTSRSALEGERKQVTVLFADLKGSMELLAERDPEDARQLLDPVLERMMAAVHRYEGTVNQVMGDGIMALFGAPLAHEDHAVRACYAALAMQAAVHQYATEVQRTYGVPLQMRVGLNAGEVVVRAIGNDLHMDYSAIGQTTHLAARMEQMAMPGTILLTPAVLRLADGLLQVTPVGPVPIKGLAEPVEVFELRGATALRRRLQTAVARGLSPFVGRQREMEALQQALVRAGAGQGQVVALLGEPGVGKSRLVYECVHSHHTQGWLRLESSSVSYGKATAYLPVCDLLKTYCHIEDRDALRTVQAKVTGQIPFASGCHYAASALFPFVELVDGAPVLAVDTGMPVTRAAIVPMRDLDLADTWHTMGMRGTGSADMVLRGVFVADAHVFPVGPLTTPNPKLDGPLARMFPLLSVHGESGLGKSALIHEFVSSIAVDATIDATTINTNNEKRDAHLKSADFFEVAKYPTLTFKSKKVEPGAAGKFKLVGDLTMHGVTKEVTFDVDGPTGPVNAGRNFVVGATATTTINRSDWGLKWNRAIEAGGVTVSDAVKITLGIEANKPNPNAPPPPPRPGQ
jgi:class 3 adenylate cyclase